MNENVKQKSNKGLIVLVIILLIIILVLGGYIVYDKVISNNKDVNEETIKDDEISLSDEEINNYLTYVPLNVSGFAEEYGIDAYYGDKETISSINKEIAYGNAYSLSEKTSLREEFDSSLEINTSLIDSCVTKTNFNNEIKQLYNVNLEVKKFEYDAGTVYTTDNLYCYYVGSGLLDSKHKVNKVLKTKVNDNELIIYEKAGFYQYVGEIIVTLTSKDSDVVYNVNLESYNYDDEKGKEVAETYINDNINDFKTFKHTFKKNSDGNYYWYSTEVDD
jgi:hypothetical protein